MSVPTRLGLSNAVLSDSLPSVITSIFPAISVTDTSHVRCTYVKHDDFPETERIVFGQVSYLSSSFSPAYSPG